MHNRGSICDIRDELKNFLIYTENSTDEFAESCNSCLVKAVNESVRNIKKSNEMGVNYMFEEMYRNELLNEGRVEGRAEGKAEGKTESKEDVAVKMIKEGWEYSVINRLTQVSFDRIKTLAAACNA
ncbi:MAG: hypothetical protein LIO44_03870 [Eubacterium sp.]|nr:hypothetical protein [Eubacterium sp.]